MEMPPEYPGATSFDNFKRKFPMFVTHIDGFFEKINGISGDTFTPEEMAAQFKSQAWTEPETIDGERGHSSQLTDATSTLRKFLATLPDCDEN